MWTQLSNARIHDGLYADVNTAIIGPLSRRRPLYRCKHNYDTSTVTTASMQIETQLAYIRRHDGLYADVSTRSPSRRPLFRCKHNYDTIMVNDTSMQT